MYEYVYLVSLSDYIFRSDCLSVSLLSFVPSLHYFWCTCSQLEMQSKAMNLLWYMYYSQVLYHLKLTLHCRDARYFAGILFHSFTTDAETLKFIVYSAQITLHRHWWFWQLVMILCILINVCNIGSCSMIAQESIFVMWLLIQLINKWPQRVMRYARSIAVIHSFNNLCE